MPTIPYQINPAGAPPKRMVNAAGTLHQCDKTKDQAATTPHQGLEVRGEEVEEVELDCPFAD